MTDEEKHCLEYENPINLKELKLYEIILSAIKRKLLGCEHNFVKVDEGWKYSTFNDFYIVSYICCKCGKIRKIKRK